MVAYLKAMADAYLGEKGQGIVEYAVILAFVVAVAVAIGSSGSVRTSVSNVFTDIGTMIK